jgi:hypothetical protein
MAALRARRATWHQQHTRTGELARPGIDIENRSRADDLHNSSVIEWRLQHIGYGSDGDRMLAVSAAVRAREHRLVARAEYADLIDTENDWAAA